MAFYQQGVDIANVSRQSQSLSRLLINTILRFKHVKASWVLQKTGAVTKKLTVVSIHIIKVKSNWKLKFLDARPLRVVLTTNNGRLITQTFA